MSKIQAVFAKFDIYNNAVFYVLRENDQTNYNLLKKYHDNISKRYGSFNPIYVNDDFVTIKFKRVNKNAKLVSRDTYEIIFTVKMVEKDEKQYVNCFIDTIAHVKKAVPFNDGIILNLD